MVNRSPNDGHTWPTLPSCAVLLALLGLAWLPMAAGASWPTFDWTVTCTPDHAEALEPLGDCDDTAPAGAAAFVRHELELASRWLADKGLSSPRLNRVDGRYPAQVYAGERVCHEDECLETDAAGVYFADFSFGDEPSRFDPALYVSAEQSVGMDGEVIGFGTPVHELVHAIQHAYSIFRAIGVADWITEGTAEGVALDWLRRRTEGVPMPGRNYSEPLHAPDDPEDGQNTATFWMFVRQHHAPDRTWSYLDRVFAANLYDNGLAPVHTAFVREGMERGLQGAFLAFMARISLAAEDRVFNPCGELSLDPDRTEDRARRRVREVAGECFRIAVEGDEQGRWLEVELDNAAPASSLHLAVDGSSRNSGRFRTYIPAGDSRELFAIVANVADEPGTTAAVDATLVARWGEPSGWQASISGNPTGSHQLSGAHGQFEYSDRTRAGGSYHQLMTAPGSPEPGPPWLKIELWPHGNVMALGRELGSQGASRAELATISILVPNAGPGIVGNLPESLLTLQFGADGKYRSNADWGSPTGNPFRSGNLRTAEVHLDEHSEEMVSGRFQARLTPFMFGNPPTGPERTMKSEMVGHYPEHEVLISGSFEAVRVDETLQLRHALDEFGVDPRLADAMARLDEELAADDHAGDPGEIARLLAEASGDPGGGARPTLEEALGWNEAPEGLPGEEPTPPGSTPTSPGGAAAQAPPADADWIRIDGQTTGLSVDACDPTPEGHLVPGVGLRLEGGGALAAGQAFTITTAHVPLPRGTAHQTASLVLENRAYDAGRILKAGQWLDGTTRQPGEPIVSSDGNVIRGIALMAERMGEGSVEVEFRVDCGS
jgi:hypothetical protein